ncbi:protein-disulfide reductase DsbD family protein [Sphingobium sp.]|uniref:protein-disulfide reductase DsbD family protein n=1 Tax=Sphingobium sp. TaxID=1912891 RepID=UPI002C9B90F6|nr:thioredoxin family protein [Sphingobium sp.]HUD93473.1 thioredoxin family protein [Sphingobium sp.]
MLFAILSAFAGGIILNLMPCVFPVISLKAFGLVRQGGDQVRLRQEGIAFFVGSLLAMLALAGILLALRAAGQGVGWGFQLQSPIIVTLLILVILGSSLNLFGLFEFGVGLQRAGQQVDTKEGPLGAALTGALVVVLATPCAGPFMAGALGYALVQPPLAGLAVFAALGAGVAAPFTLLSFSPALARRLPRPGPWMNTLKHVLAFPMLAAAAWLVWVLAQQTGPSGLALILGCAVGLAFVGWIYGMAQRRGFMGQSTAAFHIVAGAGVVAIGTAILLPDSAIRSPVPAASALATMSDPSDANPTEVRPIAWSAKRTQAERAAGRPIFVDFSAAWCATCQVNEKAVLSTKAFKDAIARTKTVYMVADSTNYDPAIEKAMNDLGRTGLPLYLVYPAGGGEPVVLPQVLSRDIAVEALEAAARGKA